MSNLSENELMQQKSGEYQRPIVDRKKTFEKLPPAKESRHHHIPIVSRRELLKKTNVDTSTDCSLQSVTIGLFFRIAETRGDCARG